MPIKKHHTLSITSTKIMMRKYPYQNLSIETLKGEQWKDIPKLEMYFQVSNFGRIKRLEYELEYSDGRIYKKPEKIIKPMVRQLKNQFINDTIFFLHTRVTLYKQNYNFSLARLVYQVFVEPFNRDDERIVILCKDGNGLNIKVQNLKMASHSEKQKRMFELNRRAQLFTRSDAWRRGIEKSKQTNSRQVTQYTIQGEKIKTYPSVVSAAKKTGISHSHICSRANGAEFSAGGFIWRYGNAKQIDITPMLLQIERRRKRNKEKFGKKVTQYNMKGKRITAFATITDATKATGINISEISAVANKKRNSSGGFYWLWGNGPAQIDLSNHEYGEALRTKKKQRKIKQYSLTGKYLYTFDSIKEAAKQVDVHTSTIIGALTGRHTTAGGYKWVYVVKN